jgi:zinc transport system substrate-binding protein
MRPISPPPAFLAFAVLVAGLAAGTALNSDAAAAASDPPKVVASIAPVHSLVAGVMAGVGEPVLLVKGGASPHTYALKPSDAAALAAADVVFRVGPGLEAFLDGPLQTLAGGARVVELAAAPGLTLLPVREGGVWEAHDHGHEGEADGHDADLHPAGEDHDDEHAAAAGDAHGHGDEAGQEEAADAHAEHGHEDHDHEGNDMHLWLDPRNAAAMTKAIVTALSAADPAHAATYAANGAAVEARISALDDRLAAELAPVRGKPFIVFHDAYQYLDERYGLAAVGAITVNPERSPGAERILAIRAKIADLGAVCVFTEPQFEPRVVTRLVEDTGVRTGVLDPDAAAGRTPGENLYFELMNDLADSLVHCLDGSS